MISKGSFSVPIKPILFNSEMVKAILEGRKTVTRRAVKPQPVKDGRLWLLDGAAWTDSLDSVTPVPCHSLYNLAPFCPGDILYVREAWRCQAVGYPPRYCVIEYKAGGLEKFDEIHAMPTGKGEWKPSIHMPKKIARIFLRVKSIRMEQLRSITAEGAINEGFADRNQFAELWDKTIPMHPNKFKCNPYYWKDNPWVWVIEFERCKNPEVDN